MPREPKVKKTKKSAAPFVKIDKKSDLFQSRPKVFHIGGDLRPGMDLRHFVKWPKYVRIQRQRRILQQRLKVPPALNMFTKTMEKNMAVNLFKFLAKYKPEDKLEKKTRLREEATAAEKGEKVEKTKPFMLKYGLNHVVALAEAKKAKLVVIAHDVQPIELVVFLPTLCRKMDIPFCIVKGKSRLGQLVHKKNASCVAITDVKPEDKGEFTRLIESVRASFNDRFSEFRKMWGGGILGEKSRIKIEKRKKLLEKELAERLG
uniref:60S ribosomal protein L7a n=1 Tax=Stygiella incarcerata TaxID=1712417 RepID=A0A192ZII7_9EUKA|nr:60S ribosomal protein L7a [Stygiella incarcerata]|eukprot:TRINITY_DN1_c0_g1_i1.p1 TRINITY_DN1_c0_g1~~TRINITY_DN1_c0_g1_i1.p1  ORF type:complete len:261 (+),score=75.11 TRINITY_DN1_c0_g1_i1:113-895(+)